MLIDIKKYQKELQIGAWKQDPYIKQNWGNWFHSISSYVGRIKPAFAHWLIKIFTEEDDVVLDPFCGVGTVLLESKLLGRKSIGVDVSPYAIKVAKAKFDISSANKEIEYLEKIKFDYKKKYKEDPFIKEFYHPKTLLEIRQLINKFEQDKKDFLMGCLLGISHGHRPQHLSMRTGYIIPYIPNPKPEVIYKESIPRMISKVKRMYKDGIKKGNSPKIYQSKIIDAPIKENSIDKIISSPPYYNTIDYVHSNRVRLYFSGISFEEQEKLKNEIIQDRSTYESRMKETGEFLYKILKKNGLIIFVLGDVHVSKNKTLNTAKNISEIYKKIGFKTQFIYNDEIPAARTTIVKYGGKKAIDAKKLKYDRILVMSK